MACDFRQLTVSWARQRVVEDTGDGDEGMTGSGHGYRGAQGSQSCGRKTQRRCLGETLEEGSDGNPMCSAGNTGDLFFRVLVGNACAWPP